MKKLLKYLKKYRRDCVTAPLFKLFEAVLELLVPILVARMIDVGIRGEQPGVVTQTGLLLCALALMGFAAALSAQYFAARAATGFACDVKSALIRRIEALSFRQTDEISVPTLITRMTSDVNQLQTGVNLTLRLLLRSPFVVFGAMIMAFVVDARAALLFAALIPLLGLCVYLVMRRTLPGYRDIQRAQDRVLGDTRENLSGVRVIRAFGREEAERERFKRDHQILTALQVKIQTYSSLLNPLTLLLVNLTTAALIYVGAVRVEAGGLTQGEVMALVSYMSQILVELLKLANLLVTISKALACADRVAEVMETAPDMVSGTEKPDFSQGPAVELRNVSLSYAGHGKEAVRGISLTLSKGESLGIIGGTGAGKSTLAAIIPRLYDVTAGEALVGGRDVRELDLRALRACVGYVPQKAKLFSGTLRDNLLMGDRGASDESVWQALRTAQAAEFVEKLPQGLDSPVQQGGSNFSGGQRQRLTIARALVRKPDILILDDSASALDAQTDRLLSDALKKDARDAALVVISQRASSVMGLDHILVLEDGALAGYGRHEELLSSCPVYRETYEAQFPPQEATA